MEIADAGRSNEIILSCDGFVQSSNCTFDDGSPAIEPCELCLQYICIIIVTSTKLIGILNFHMQVI